MLLYFAHGPRSYRKRPVRRHTRQGWEFQAVLAGRIAPTLDDRTGAPELQRRRLWVFGPDCEHGWTGGGEARMAVWHFARVNDTLARHVGASGVRSVALGGDDLGWLAKFVTDTTKHYPRTTNLTTAVTDSVLAQLSLFALRGLRVQHAVHQGAGRQHAVETYARAVAWFQEHVAQGPSVAQVAKALAVSEAHLRRLFRAAGQPSPRRVFNALRVDQAEQLLRTTDHKIAVIAEAVGFSGPQAFCRAYRSATGRSPGADRHP